MDQDYGKVGPLSIIKVLGKDLIAGDVITHDNQLKVVLKSYSLEHLRQQNLDVETGEQDEDGECISPYPIRVSMDTEFIILRSVKEKELPKCPQCRKNDQVWYSVAGLPSFRCAACMTSFLPKEG